MNDTLSIVSDALIYIAKVAEWLKTEPRDSEYSIMGPIPVHYARDNIGSFVWGEFDAWEFEPNLDYWK